VPTTGNPRIQVRVPPAVDMAFAEMERAGVTATEAVTALADAWRTFQRAAGGNGDGRKFIQALHTFGQIDPTAAAIDLDQIRREAREAALLDAARQTLREAEEALLLGITAAMVVLMDDEGGVIPADVIEGLVARWFRKYSDDVRRILARSSRQRDMLCNATGRLAGESSQGAAYVRRIVAGEQPGVVVV
jgi:hypothetical protein